MNCGRRSQRLLDSEISHEHCSHFHQEVDSEKETQLLGFLNTLGLVKESATLDDVLKLTLKTFLNVGFKQ